ncbi:MAG: hypothetical protein H7X97_00530 [Opitutaceae bacterium]|nr:hypothetical protein [Verrucomicrobiales bacterium]
MKTLLQSKWMVLLLGAVLYLATTVLVWKPLPAPVPHSSDAAHERYSPKGPSWDFANPEIDQIIEELKKEKTTLADREQKLNELASRLQTERMELNQVTQTVHQLQRDFDATVLRVQDEETANLKKLAKLYAAMEPTSAALVMKELDEPTIVKILVFMKDEEAAPILESIAKKGETDARRVASISERLRLAIFRKPSEKPKS